jgi:hypothetical protein
MEREKYREIAKELHRDIWGDEDSMSSGSMWYNATLVAVDLVTGLENATDEEERVHYQERLDVLETLPACTREAERYLSRGLPDSEYCRIVKYRQKRIGIYQERLRSCDSISERQRLLAAIDHLDREMLKR